MIFDFTINSDANYVLIDIKFINGTMMIILLLIKQEFKKIFYYSFYFSLITRKKEKKIEIKYFIDLCRLTIR